MVIYELVGTLVVGLLIWLGIAWAMEHVRIKGADTKAQENQEKQPNGEKQ